MAKLNKTGSIIIDSGTLIIGDPGNISNDKRLHSYKGWLKYINEVLVPMDKNKQTNTADNNNNIISMTGGDGEFNVYAVSNKNGKTKQIIIDLESSDNFLPPHFTIFE